MFFLLFLWGCLQSFAFQNPYIPSFTPPQSVIWPHNFKNRPEGDLEGRESDWRCRSLWLSDIVLYFGFQGRFTNGPCVFAIVVCFYRYMRSNSPSRGGLVFLENAAGPPLYGIGFLLICVKSREGVWGRSICLLPVSCCLSPLSFQMW